MILSQTNHAKLLCPFMRSKCTTDGCAMWRWEAGPMQIKKTVTNEEVQKLEASGWTFSHNELGGVYYKRPFSLGERHGGCSLAKG